MKRRPLVKVLKRIHGAYQWVRYGVNCALGAYRRDITIDGNPACLGENICIFSIFNTKEKILRSTLSLVKAIKKEGYSLVLVVNGQKVARQWFEGEIADADVVITRPNLGRDFAAYQLATTLILDASLTIRRLLYCNDSIFYLDKNDPQNIFAHLAASDDHWIGMTENYERRYHVSSWCFQLSAEIIYCSAFIEFWKTYRPVDNRRHAIRRGEIMLSKVLLQAGYVPRILFSTSLLLKTILEKYKYPNQKFLLQQLCMPSLPQGPPSELKAVLQSIFYGEELNQANNLGVVLVFELGFPFVKKSIAFQANWPISVIFLILEELMSGFSAETAIEVRLKGIRRSLSPWKRLLVDAGVI
jgi:hypothetical protein